MPPRDPPAVVSRRDLVHPVHCWLGSTWEIRARPGHVSLILNGSANSTLRTLQVRALLDALAEAVDVAEQPEPEPEPDEGSTPSLPSEPDEPKDEPDPEPEPEGGVAG